MQWTQGETSGEVACANRLTVVALAIRTDIGKQPPIPILPALLTSKNYTTATMRIARFAILGAACVLLYYGLGMLLLVPGDPGGPYWLKERVVYGLLPVFAGALVFALSTWLAIRLYPQADSPAVIKRNFIYAAIGIALVFALLILNDVYFHVGM